MQKFDSGCDVFFLEIFALRWKFATGIFSNQTLLKQSLCKRMIQGVTFSSWKSLLCGGDLRQKSSFLSDNLCSELESCETNFDIGCRYLSLKFFRSKPSQSNASSDFNVRSFLVDGPADFEHLGCNTAKPLICKQDASDGNRTLVTSMATMYSTTRPLMLLTMMKAEITIVQLFLPSSFGIDSSRMPSGTPPS